MNISVVVCTYNGEKFIKEQIFSILRQSVRIDEIIVCDDGSSDNTIAYVKEILNIYNIASKIIINDQNLGISKNFENGIKHTSGSIIFLSDQDDIWMPNKIEKHLSIYNRNPDINLIFSNAKLLKDGVFEKDLLWERVNFILEEKKGFLCKSVK
jgi:glycosyltransferase involved in cell wall biosynthesis